MKNQLLLAPSYSLLIAVNQERAQKKKRKRKKKKKKKKKTPVEEAGACVSSFACRVDDSACSVGYWSIWADAVEIRHAEKHNSQ